MQKIILKRVDLRYRQILIEGLELGIFKEFLTDDVTNLAHFWIKWLNNPQSFIADNNATIIEKYDNDPNLILISPVFTDDGPYFSIKKQKLIELLQKWDELMKQQPNYIVITMDGDDITM